MTRIRRPQVQVHRSINLALAHTGAVCLAVALPSSLAFGRSLLDQTNPLPPAASLAGNALSADQVHGAAINPLLDAALETAPKPS